MIDSGNSRSEPSRESLAVEFLGYLERASIRWAVVGDGLALGGGVASRVEVVVDRYQLSRIPRLIERFAHESGVQLVQMVEERVDALYVVLAWRRGDCTRRFLSLEVFGDWVQDGVRLVSGRTLLEQRERVSARGTGGDEIFVPAPRANFLYCLLTSVMSGQLSETRARLLSELWRADAIGCEKAVERFRDPGDRDLLADACESGDWERVRERIASLRDGLDSSLARPLSLRLAQLVCNVRRVARPTGLMVALLGPDGSGKSSIAERVVASLAPAFRGSQLHHLRPDPFRRQGPEVPHPAPHGDPARGLILSLAKLVLWWMEYALGFVGQVAPRLAQSELVVFDRYFDDLLVDPERYRYGGPQRIAAILGRFIPRPDLLVVLDAPAELLVARKGEITLEAAVRLRGGYEALASSTPRGVLVDASQGIAEVTDAVGQTILDQLVARTASRLGQANGMGNKAVWRAEPEVAHR